jgi:hypothetical protein
MLITTESKEGIVEYEGELTISESRVRKRKAQRGLPCVSITPICVQNHKRKFLCL